MISRTVLCALLVISGVAACSSSTTDTARTTRLSDAGEDGRAASGGAQGSAGSSNNGGTSVGTAGSGGTTGSGGASTTGTGGSAACNDCSGVDLRWGMDGGYAAYVDTSRITSCRGYSRERTSMPPLKCTVTLPSCPDRTVDAIARALSDGAVVAALHDHKLFGTDPRGVDGSVFRIAVANDYLDVGPNCETGCAGMPPALVTLVGLLRSLDERELAAEPCKTAFGG